MKKFLILFLPLILVGCQSPVSTFDFVIEDNQVDFDGVKYDVISITETTHEYDGDLLIKSRSIRDGSEQTTDFLYSDDLLIEETRISQHLNYKRYYYYDDQDRVIKTVDRHELGDLVTEYEFDGKYLKVIPMDQDGNVTSYNVGTQDENGNIIEFTAYNEDDSEIATVNQTFENDLLISSISRYTNGSLVTSYHEYNNLDDKMFSYYIHHDEDVFMIVHLYEYEYNKKKQPIVVKKYQIQSIIRKDQVRDYWDDLE